MGGDVEQGELLETYGVAVAHQVRFPHAEDDVVRRLGCSTERWEALRAEGRRVLMDAARQRDAAALTRFGDAFLKTQLQLAAMKPQEAPSRAGSAPEAPDDAAPSPAPPRLSLHEYASLRAECMGVPPETVKEVRARHGLDADTDMVEVEAWSRKFAAEPGLFEEYKALFQHLRLRALDAIPGPPSRRSVQSTRTRVPGVRHLSMHQYASFRAECIETPSDRLNDTRARYGLDGAGDAEEADAWAREFAANPRLFEQYKGLFQYFRSLARAGR